MNTKLLDKEKVWLELNNLKSIEINPGLARKAIFNTLYSDSGLDGVNLQNYISRNFNTGEYEKYFDLLTIDEENQNISFILFFDSVTDSNLKILINKIRNCLNLIRILQKEIHEDNNYFSYVTSKNTFLFNKFNEIMESSDFVFKIICFDENTSNALKEEDFRKVTNNFSSAVEISLLKTKQYITKMGDSSQSIYSFKEKQKPIEIEYYDNNPSQTTAPTNRNFIQYSNHENHTQNYIFSFRAYDLVKAFQEYGDELFDKNVRYGLMGAGGISGQVNSGIQYTLEKHPADFWILNNGLTIVADLDRIDEFGKKVLFKNIDIVNGAQTVTNFAKFAKKNLNALKEVYIPAKVICLNEDNLNQSAVIGDIVKSANSQKPISDRDLVSNNHEMKTLQKVFADNGVILQIKRGANEDNIRKTIIKEKGPIDISIEKNDKVGQYIMSLIFEFPTAAIQLKNKLFSPENYGNLFDNEKIKPLDIFAAYRFYLWFFDKLDESGQIYENLDFSPDEDTDNEEVIVQTRRALYYQIKPWIIAFFWYLRWFNRDKTIHDQITFPNKLDAKNQLASERTKMNLFVIANDELQIPENFLPETANSMIRVLNFMNEKIYEVYKKANADKRQEKNSKKDYSIPAFSYRQNYFKEWVVIICKDIDRLKDDLEKIMTRLIYG